MSIDNLKSALPEYAKDQKLNIGSLARSTELNEEQLWGSLVAAAAATERHRHLRNRRRSRRNTSPRKLSRLHSARQPSWR